MHGIPVREDIYDYDEPRYCPPRRNQFSHSPVQEELCPTCHGRGKVALVKCTTCKGQGLVT